MASKVGPNGWGLKADADGSVDHYSNALGEVPEWVFTGSADHAWKDYDGVYGQVCIPEESACGCSMEEKSVCIGVLVLRH